MASLTNTIALVTGASRGVGKGIALGLGEAGATVYVTGRTSDQHTSTDAGSIEATAAEVTRLGGLGISVRCDHRNDTEVEALFTQIRAEQGRLDLLVNNVWGGYEQMSENGEWTWERPSGSNRCGVGKRCFMPGFVPTSSQVVWLLRS